VESLIKKDYFNMEEKKQVCPDCQGTNITRAEKNKKDKFLHMRTKLYKCHDCGYIWYKITGIGGK
jgi:predicted RNA-binding Zn-ribbon protein involved in translation (DUF1610 family)